MDWLVFAQAEDARLDLAKLLHNARRFFALSVDVLAEEGVSPGAAPPPSLTTRLRVDWAAQGLGAEFHVVSRPTEPADLERAQRAEAQSRGAGLAGLAARCRHVWVVRADGEVPESLRSIVAALLASVALGPVLPPGDAELFGVRGAMERCEALTGGHKLTR